ncbi:MAG: CvpA family protein [Bacteroidales bacterium]|nr:CvpA family protein [Bacteroidales bacterium]
MILSILLDGLTVFIPSLFDFLIVLTIFFGIFRGYTQGFIVQAISLFALLAGIYIATGLSMGFYNLIVDKSNVPLRNLPVIVFSLLFAFVFFGSNWVGIYVKKLVISVPVNIYGRVIGAFFGAIKYLFVASIVLLFVDRLDSSFTILNKENDSKLYEPVLLFGPTIIPKLNFEIKTAQPIELEDITIDTDNAD